MLYALAFLFSLEKEIIMLYILAFLLLADFIVVTARLFKIKWINRLLALFFWAVAGVVVSLLAIVFILICLTSLENAALPVSREPEIIALGEGKRGDKYYYTVMIKKTPKDADSLKALMVRYFYKKSKYVSDIHDESYLGEVYFYKYTKKIADDEPKGGFSADYMNKYRKMRIGYISARNRCRNETDKYEDVMYIYENNGRDIRRETADGLYGECSGR
jgi:hypothetical protein